MDCAVLGGGAMGTLLAGRLAGTSADVTLIDTHPAHVRTINTDGITIETTTGTTETASLEATTEPETLEAVDLLVVCVKRYDTADALASATAVYDDTTTVLTLQNGIGTVETLTEFVAVEQLIVGTTAHGATVVGPGRVRHAGTGATTVGQVTDTEDDTVDAVASLLSAAGFDAEIAEDIDVAVWRKLLVNIGINAATALARVPNGALVDTEPGTRLLEGAVSEGIAVANAEGIPLSEELVAETKTVARQTASNTSSMRQDLEDGSQTEIESLHGELLARADAHDIDVPVNRTLCDLIRLAE